jgi:hypothetical protein
MEAGQEYRMRAAQARRLSRSVTDPLMREQLEMAARDYDQMANQQDNASTAKPQSDERVK